MLETFGVLVALVLAADAIETPVVDGVVVTQEIETYPVAGTTSRQLLKEMDAQARPDEVSGKRTYGHTGTDIRWSYTNTSRNGRRCTIDKVQVELDIRIRLPEWQPAGEPSQALQTQWQAFHDALTAHELQHRAFGMQAARQIREIMARMPASDCTSFHAEVGRLTGPVMQQLSDANRSYDIDTEHGRTEGAFWMAR